MNLYMVEITTYAVVLAEDEAHAMTVAQGNARDAIDADPDPETDVFRKITKAADVTHGWSVECIPYGGDGRDKTIAEILSL